MTTRNVLCAFPAPVPVGHRVELTFFERLVAVESVFSSATRISRVPAAYHPLVRDLDTGIVYADEIHFEGAGADDGSREAVEAHRVGLRDNLFPSSKLAPVEMVSGRVTECTIIGSVWVYGDDRRTHTRLVIALEAPGYRG